MFNVERNTRFSLKRKNLASSYSTLHNVKNYFNSGKSLTGNLLNINSFKEGSQLDRFFTSPGSNAKDVSQLSNTLYDTNRIYSQLLNYLSTMYYWRYTVVPRKIKGTTSASKAEYTKIYNSMLEYVDGISIETVFPTLLLNIFKNGKVNFCIHFNNNSKTVSTIILPEEYCKPTFLTQYGTQEIMFDMSFFSNLGLNNDQLDILFESFPEEFKELYVEYSTSKNKGNPWRVLNAKHSTCISMNDEGFPTFLSIFYDLIDYKTYKLNELDRNTNALEKLVTQEIDMERTGLDMEEIQDLHDSMAATVCANEGVTLVTSPGKIAVESLQDDVGQENKTLVNAYKTIYDNAGFNNELFVGDTDISLQASLNRDLAYVWSYVQKIEAFYNLAINNGKNFKNYQVSLKLLPISPFNEDEKLTIYHQAATLGVGVVDYIVASGTKQVDLEATIELEEFLDLTNRLVPLQSSHTQSVTGDADGDDGKKDADKDADNPTTDPSQEDANDEESEISKENKEKE